MNNQFNYEVRDSQELKQSLNDFYYYTREHFKNTLYSLSYKCYTNAMKCYSELTEIEQAENCFVKAINPLKRYNEKYDKIWVNNTYLLKKCIANIQEPNELSKCFNNFAKKTYNKLLKINLKYKSLYV